MNEPAVGERIGSWRLVERLGAGGMGVVFRAEHDANRQFAAVKVLHPHASENDRVRFANEARILKSMHHPGIAGYLDHIDHAGHPCLVMRYIPGPTLARLIGDKGALPPAQAVKLVRGLADAVGYLHRRGVVHRDVKAENIKIDPSGRAVLLDFGIARDTVSHSITQQHHIIGTLGGLPPERLDGKPADERTDVWGLGTLLLHALTGRTPFDAAEVAELRQRHRAGWRKEAAGVEITGGCASVLDRSLALDPRKRFPDASAMADALAAVTAPNPARNPEPTDPILASSRTRLGVGAAVAGALLVGYLLARPDPKSGVIGPTDNKGDRPIDKRGDRPTEKKGNAPPDAGNGPGRSGGQGTGRQIPATGPLARVVVDTVDGVADIYVNGRNVGSTPFRDELPVGSQVRFELRRPGFESLDVNFEVRAIDNVYAGYSLKRLP